MFFFSKIPSLRIEGTVFHVFDKVKVKITLDSSNLQHQKIRMALVEPQIPGINIPPNVADKALTAPGGKKRKLEK